MQPSTLGLSELVPPTMVIVGMYFTDWLFSTEDYIKPLVDVNAAPTATTEGRNNLTADFENLAIGWQTIVDLTYALIASIGLLGCRLIDGKLQSGWFVTAGVLVLLVCNLLLFGWACQRGPSAIVAQPFWPKFSSTRALRRRRITLHRIASKFVFYSNILLVVLMIVERVLNWTAMQA